MRWATPPRPMAPPDRRPAVRVAPTPRLSRRGWADSRVEARDVADDFFDLGDQRLRRCRFVVLTVDADRRGGVNAGGRRHAVDGWDVLTAVDAVGDLAGRTCFAGDLDQPR